MVVRQPRRVKTAAPPSYMPGRDKMHSYFSPDGGGCLHRVRRGYSRVEGFCGLPKVSAWHITYPCDRGTCRERFDSLDMRIEHWAEKHDD